MREPDVRDDAAWKRRFRVAAYLAPQVAALAPGRGLVLSNEAGSFQLYAWEVETGALRQLTQRPEGLREGHLSSDGRWVYYLEDEGGGEIGHYVRIPFEGGSAQDLTPELPPYSSWSFTESRNSGMLGLTAADDEGFTVYTMARGNGRSLGAPRPLFRSRKATFGPILSQDGRIAVVGSAERSVKNQFSLLAFPADGGERIAELWDGPDTNIEADEHAFSPLSGDSRLLATSNRTGYARPLVWDVSTDERQDLDVGGLEGEIYPQGWSSDARRILLRQVHAAEERLHVVDLETGALSAVPHPGGSWSAAQFTPDGKILAQWQDSTHPSQIVEMDPADGAPRPLLAASDAPSSHAFRSVTFPGANGDTIQGWLATPEGTGLHPAILETHGGPAMAMTEGFSPRQQVWVDHGFAVLSINYHGSTTFGKDFEESIIGRVGELEVEDMAAARDWLVDNGIADPGKILLTGWSYGGYLTLHALGVRPDLWAGGMAGVPVADWPACHEDSAETLKGYDIGLFGGRLDEVRERYESASPIRFAQNVDKPVLIIQGRNDTRCPARQVEMYEAKMREMGKDLQVVWFDAGHGSLVVEQVIGHIQTMLEFAHRVVTP